MHFLKHVILKSSGKAERTSQVAPGVEIQSANAEDVKDTGSVLSGEDLLGKDVAIHPVFLLEHPIGRGAWQATCP